jgi:Zn-finger nucleic acid-binding protein
LLDPAPPWAECSRLERTAADDGVVKLIACSSCGRQYDVTHMPPKSKVRCLCDEVVEVVWHAPLAVEALKCAHCGGGVGESDEACPYCQAALSPFDRREGTLCPICYTRLHDESRHCRSCGVRIAPQAVRPVPDGKSCPRCSGELRVRMLESVTAIECGKCQGLWIAVEALEAICSGARARVAPSPTPVRGKPSVRGEERSAPELQGYIPCLSCGELMFRRRFQREGLASGVVIDQCGDHGIWLDHEELQRIVAFLESGAAKARAGRSTDVPSIEALMRSEIQRERKRKLSLQDILADLFHGLVGFLTAD